MTQPIPIRPRSPNSRRCRVMNIGPDPAVRNLLMQFAQNDESVSIDHLETGSIALDILSMLPESDLPQMIIVPSRLPFLTALDFINALRAQEQLQEIPVFVWGSHLGADEIKKIYNAGAACVFVGQFNTPHLNALRHFCNKWTGVEDDESASRSPSAIASTLRQTREKAVRNLRLGAMFVWTGCLAALFWTCAFLGTHYVEGNFAALSVYAGLTSAGFSLIRLARA